MNNYIVAQMRTNKSVADKPKYLVGHLVLGHILCVLIDTTLFKDAA